MLKARVVKLWTNCSFLYNTSYYNDIRKIESDSEVGSGSDNDIGKDKSSIVVMVAVMRHTNEHTPLCASAAPKVKSPGGLTLIPISACDYDFL